MPPPQLARDAPGLDVVHPVEIGLFPRLRHDLDRAGLHRLNRGLCERFGIDIPLVGQPRFDHLPRTVTIGRLDDAIFDLVEQADCVDSFDHLLARIEPVEPQIVIGDQAIRDLNNLRLGIEHVEHLTGLEPGALADFEVVEIVSRRDLDRT